MSLSVGIVGLPNVGKSTLFNALTRAGAQVANYPFTTIDPNTGIVPVPDARLERIAAIVRPKKMTPTTIEFVDIAGLVRGASKGEGLGNQFLSHIRTVDAIAMVVRCFTDSNVAHVDGAADAPRDISTVNIELGLADLATIERRIEKTAPVAHSGDKHALAELVLLEKLAHHLNSGKPARQFSRHEDEAVILRDLRLLTDKPILYVANVDEALSNATSAMLQLVQQQAASDGAEFLSICAKIEDELAALSPADAADYRAALGVSESGLDMLIHAGYRLLNLVTFFTTAGEKEVRAWTIQRGCKAPQAAGKVHSDMEKGFIRAEVIHFDDLDRCASFAVARERGLIRLEGRDYVVQDGDVVHIRFSPA
jgi:GTP-binding protein YchF